MGFWTWFWIWTALVISALTTLGFIAKSLFDKLYSVGHQISRLTNKASGITSQLGMKPDLPAIETSLLANPAIAQGRRRAIQKAKIKKQEQRQRRLIASLKRFDPNESRFH
jgi:hypothetical protein